MSGLISDFLLSGSNLTYTQRYAYNYAIKSLTWAIFLTMISFIGQSTCEKFKSKPSTNKKTSTAKSDPLLDPCSSHDLNNIQWHLNYREIEKELKRNNNSQPILARVGIHMSSIGHFLAYMVYGSIPAILSSLGIIPVWLSCLMIFLMSLIAGCFAVKIFYTPEIKQLIASKQCFKGKDGSEPILRRFYNQAYHIYRLYPSDVKRLAVFALCYSLCLPNLTSDSCLAYYTPEYGSVFDAYSISTSFVRFLTRSESCPSGRICHLYTTLPEDPSTSVFLNLHTGTDVDTLQVVYSSEDDLDEQHSIFSGSNKTAQSYFLNLERKARRYIHSVYLDNLQPNTPYYAQIYYKDTLLGDARFSTLPDTKMQSNITMIIGGDSSGTDKSLAFITRIADYNPDVIIIGGDIVYDNGNPNCYYCWDYYLDHFSALNNKVGRIVPLILAIGNHDIGMNNHQFLHVDKSQNLFFQFFPQHTRPNLTKPEVPDPEERMSYFYHRIGNMLHVFLDSGYLERYADHQLEWLRNISKKYPYMAKFATYHVPIFPGCFFNPLETKKYDSRFYSWISIFEKNHFMGVFENHVHLFKRTFPLTFHSNNSRSPGVVYFGDGAWGVNENDCFDRDPHPNITEVFARVGKVSHVWVVRVNKKTVEYSAINVEGEVIDEYKQNIGDYVGSKKIFKHYSGQISLPNITIDA